MHPELTMLLWVVGALVVFGIPTIMKKTMLPRDLQFEEVPPERLTPRQAEFLAGYDTQIRALGYDDFVTYRVTNLKGANICRTYFSRNSWSRCTVAAVTVEKKMSTSWIEFNSNFSDGTMLSTRNTQFSSPFSRPPYQIVQLYPGVSDPARLKASHDQRVESFAARGQVFIDRNNFFDEFRKGHQRNCEHQASKKLMRLDGNGIYRATSRLALRAIVRFLNPFSDNFTPARAAAGLLLGAGLPFAVTIASGPLALWASPHLGVTPEGGALLMTAGAFILTGVALGRLFQHKVFIWALLLGYLPTALMGGPYGLSFSLLMAWTADLTQRVRSRRRAIA
ncbi:MAG: hypothetical protein LAO06_03345 [Acidobacteriia bacterium]|nr:hypothetical protein [Terriglobia bacterium]